jgi:hypothetical protein
MTTPTISELRPRNSLEEVEAARAVYKQRELDEARELVDALTDREKLLIEHAWQAGADAARTKLKQELVHPHASTLDAKSVALAVNRWADTPDMFALPTWSAEPKRYDERVVRLVRQVFKRLEREQTSR